MEHPHRPGVGDHVVHEEEEGVIVSIDLEEPGAEERASREIDGASRLVGHLAEHQGFPLGRRAIGPAGQRQRDRRRFVHDEQRATLGEDEGAAQHLVAAHHLAQGTLQRAASSAPT
jgi:hypothetical protein